MPSFLVRARLVALVVALPLALTVQTRAHGQEPALEVFYTKLEPKEQFKYKWKGKEAVCTAGVFRWEVPASEFGTHGLDRNFTGYCAEVLVPIIADKTYRFQTNNIYAAENYNLAGVDKDKTGEAANRRAEVHLGTVRPALPRPDREAGQQRRRDRVPDRTLGDHPGE